jgi:catechol 2,3-dioxygenase-like lactoylglutathione lyase family enzyme
MPLERLDHLLVLTDDLEASRRFYCDALGLDVGERPPLEFPGYWLYLGGVPCLHLAERDGFEQHARSIGLAAHAGTIDHVAFTGSDYEELTAKLADVGIEATANTVPGGSLRQLFVTDPNGLRVELSVSTL